MTCGGCVSCTVTVKLQGAGAPLAVQTTLLVPRRKPVPLGGTQVTGTGPFAFEAVTMKFTGVRPPVHSAVTFAQETVGADTSTTSTVKVHPLELPTESVDLQRTVVAPIGKVLPEFGEQSKVAMPQGSEAAAV